MVIELNDKEIMSILYNLRCNRRILITFQEVDKKVSNEIVSVRLIRSFRLKL